MKLYIIIPLFWLSLSVTVGQNRNLDSLKNQIEQQKLTERSNHKVDSIQAAFYQESDSIKNLFTRKFSKLDSAQFKLKTNLDSVKALQFSPDEFVSGTRADSARSRFTNRVDSLKLHLQTSKIARAMDSINSLRDSTLVSLNQKIQALKDKTVGKLEDLNLPPQLDSKVSKMKGDINGFTIPASDLNISSLNVGNSSSLGKLDNLNLPSPGQGLGNVGGLENVKGELGGLNGITGKAGDYSKDVQQLAKGNLTEVKELPKTAEAKAEELSGLNEVKEQTQVLDEYKDMAGKMQNPDSLKEYAMQEIKQVAVNHFAGKEQALKEAMETISKYKSKYSSINSISDITKKPPNEMRGKPFIERIIPGIGIQVQKKGDDVLVDFNPYAGYRFTGRITGGLGWNQRIAYTIDKNKVNPNARIFGPRAYGEFKLWKGFSPRAEIEVMNTNVPPLTRTPSVDPGKREWIWGAFVGIKKEYRFIKNVKGTALVMMRLFNPDHKSPYADVLNVRFGFEFPMKKKVKG